jgi:hypothetical protein
MLKGFEIEKGSRFYALLYLFLKATTLFHPAPPGFDFTTHSSSFFGGRRR